MQQKETTKDKELTDISRLPEKGRLIALDPGTKKLGVAVCDEGRVTTRPLPKIARTSWKQLLAGVRSILSEYDACGLVVGLPYNFDGTESEMSAEARRLARNFSLSLDVPVFLQDERATTYEARGRLWQRNAGEAETAESVDSEAAAIILADFLDRAGKS